MPRGLILFNSIGVLVLALIAGLQWWNNLAQHEQFQEERRAHVACETELTELRQRAESLDGDVLRLKAGLTDAQKAANEASTARPELEGQIKVLTAERDQLKQQLAMWETAVKDRDIRITTLSAQIKEARARLDEAIQRLEGKKK